MYLKPLLLGKQQQQQRLTHIPRLSIISAHMYVGMYVPRRIPDTLRYMYVLRYVSDVSYDNLCMCHVRDERARPPRKVMKVESAACRCEEKASIFCLFVSVLFRFLTVPPVRYDLCRCKRCKRRVACAELGSVDWTALFGGWTL